MKQNPKIKLLLQLIHPVNKGRNMKSNPKNAVNMIETRPEEFKKSNQKKRKEKKIQKKKSLLLRIVLRQS